MAINTCRAPRRTEDFLHLSTSTSDLVAPGSYEREKPAVGESAVPFMSLQEKILNPMSSSSKLTPGPGTYMGQDLPALLDELPANGISTTAFRSKAKRFGPAMPGASPYTSSTILKNPGPGTYTVQQSIIPQPKPEPLAAKRPIIEAQDRTIPSIPPTRLLPGQEPETEAAAADIANLCARHTGEPRDMAGPGEYDPRADHIVRASAPQTIFHASNKADERGLWEPSVKIDCKLPARDIPGPGLYDAPDTKEGTGAACRFNSKTPMAHELALQVDRIMPGPGAYEVSGDIDRMMLQLRQRALAMGDRHCFGSVTERIGWQRDVDHPYQDAYNVKHVPGPGHYAQPSTFPADPKKDISKMVLPDAKKKKFYGVHHPTIILALQEAEGPLQAFNSTDDRPCNKPLEQTTPAPWEYNKADALDGSLSSLLRERAKVGRKGVFGSCADRFFGSPLNGRDGLADPGPGSGGGGGPSETTGPETRSPFKSTTPRMSDPPGPREVGAIKLGNSQTPAPGAYNVTQEPNYRSPYRLPRQEHLSFGSGTTRFNDRKDVFSGHKLPVTNPDPGAYDPLSASARRVTGAPTLKAKRRPLTVGCTSAEIGPGSYESATSDLLKKTFNVSTQAPMTARPARPRYGSNVSQHGYTS